MLGDIEKVGGGGASADEIAADLAGDLGPELGGTSGGIDASAPAMDPDSVPGVFIGAGICARILLTGSRLFAARTATKWELSEAEAEALGADLDAVLAKWLPPINAERAGPEISLAMTVGMIFMARIDMNQEDQDPPDDGNVIKPEWGGGGE